MIFSIGRTTVSGLNFDPYFFQLCVSTQALKKHQESCRGELNTYLTKSVRKCSAMGRGLKMEVFFKIAQKVFDFRAAMFASPDSTSKWSRAISCAAIIKSGRSGLPAVTESP